MYKCFACMCTCAPCVCLASGSSTRATGALECWVISPTEASYVLHWFPLPRWVRQTQILCRPPRPLDCICGSSGMDYDGEEVQSHEEWTNWRDVGRRIAKRRIEKSEEGRQDTRLCSGPLLPSGNGRDLSHHSRHHPRCSTKAVREVVTGRGQEVVIQSGLGPMNSRKWKQLRIDFLDAAWQELVQVHLIRKQ